MAPEFESEQTATRDEAALVLRELADGVTAGGLRFGHDDETITIDVPDELSVEIELETEDGEQSVEVELEWPEPNGAERTGAADVDMDASVATERPAVGPAIPPESLARFEVFLDRADEWRWRLVHQNGNVIATSGEGYTRKHNATKGIRSVMQHSSRAEITEETESSEDKADK